MKTQEKRQSISVVCPVHNECENLPVLYDQLHKALDKTALAWDIILVDDGSTDGSDQVIRDLHQQDSRVQGILLSRKFGHEAAATAGIDHAEGDAIVLMDADLQDPPTLIPPMVEKWREGYDIVSAQRTARYKESVFKRASAYLFYRVMSLLVGGNLSADTGNFRLMNRPAVEAFRSCPERNRFVRALVAWTGFRQAMVPFERPPRRAGKSKYRAWQMFALALTSVTSFSVAPLRIATAIGLLVAPVATLTVLGILIGRLLGAKVPVNVVVVVSIWFFGGLQCLLVGIVGEYIGRIYIETQHRPLYIVRERLDTENTPR
ncbi:MAG: glycosyltransferase family 2 protein [Candidatus Hydrogenedentes bacterium]|nr:glycosyltransferase family 2 protein [Candidatus Hydrogenedentota bacterium]